MTAQSRLTIVGLGPGNPAQLTIEARQVLAEAPEVWFRTLRHPTVEGLPVKLHRSFDDLYETLESFEAVYKAIIERCSELAARPEGLVYAVPGDPMVAEATVRGLLARARDRGARPRIVHGVSFVEPVLGALGVDPLAEGLQIVDALSPAVAPDRPALFAQVHDERVATGLKLALLSLYPAEHEVTVVRDAGRDSASVERVPLEDLDRISGFDHLTTVFVPALALVDNVRTYDGFRAIIARLRAPDGCPWDRKQTHASLRKHLLEESYEALTALDDDDVVSLEEELGDILLQIFLHAQIGEEADEFDAADVVEGIARKIIRRHPHVFGDATVSSAEEVVQNWQALKDAEKAQRGIAREGLLDSVARALPALALSQTLQSRAAGVGFDWPDVEGVLEKVSEEVQEIGEAAPDERPSEFGDLLFSLVNYARHTGIDAEESLRLAAGRFRERFGLVEHLASQRGRELSGMTLAEMDALWDEAKRRLRETDGEALP